MVIGLDAAPPELLFEKWKGDLPVLNKLMDEGWYAPLKSTNPPITCPAWMSMMTGKDPGTLGFYGFRNRKEYNYDMSFVSSKWVKEKRVWDILSTIHKKCIVLGVPQTYPPQPVNGLLVSGFLTPDIRFNYTYPAEIKDEVKEIVGEYIFDVERGDHEQELEQIYLMTEKRFNLAEHFLDIRQWDFFMMVEMGTDRIQHFFWRFSDPDHPAYRADNPYQEAIFKYYQFVDKKIGQILNYADQETLVLVVSDHGAQKMTGGFALNEWLREKGYLALKKESKGIVPVDEASIDWDRTKAWGYGGYYGRIFINVKGREPQGIVPKWEYENIRNQLISELGQIDLSDENTKGNLTIKNKIYKPEEIYQEINNIPPDLMVYFNNLEWRSIGNLGLDGFIVPVTELEPYSANHTDTGIIISNKCIKREKEISICDIFDIIINNIG